MRRSPYTIIYTRKFSKIDELLSYIGGFIQSIIFICGYLIKEYNEGQYNIKLANKLYRFELQKTHEDLQKEKEKQAIIKQIEQEMVGNNEANDLKQKNLSLQQQLTSQTIH